jgi:hypothetical protein
VKFNRPKFLTTARTFKLAILLIVCAVSTVYSAHIGHSYAQKSPDAARAQYNLGNLHLQRSEIPKAIEYFKLSADQGFRSAQYNLGVIYARGDGVEKDPEEAFKWYALAAAQDHPTAQYNLGAFHRDGLGTAADGSKAVEWFTRAAKNGSAFAQINLARIYTLGKIIPKDLNHAYMWLEITKNPFGRARNTHSQAAKDRITNVRNSAVAAQKIIEEQISPTEVERAKARARAWLGKFGTHGK